MHSAGCRAWFLAERHTRTNEVRRTYRPEDRRPRRRERACPERKQPTWRDRPVRFRFERRTIEAQGDTVGSALAAAGVRTRHGRPSTNARLFCMDGGPTARCASTACPTSGRAPSPCAGMRVERQNAWPSADRDVHGWLNTLSFMMPPGFYCKIFSSALGGHGRSWSRSSGRRPASAGCRTSRITDAVGRSTCTSGLRTAPGSRPRGRGGGGRGRRFRRAARAGPRGGHLGRRGRPSTGGTRSPDVGVGRPVPPRDVGVRCVRRHAGRRRRSGRLYRIRARHAIFATGAVEQAAVFPGTTSRRDGVLRRRASLHRYGVLPGRRASCSPGATTRTRPPGR